MSWLAEVIARAGSIETRTLIGGAGPSRSRTAWGEVEIGTGDRQMPTPGYVAEIVVEFRRPFDRSARGPCTGTADGGFREGSDDPADGDRQFALGLGGAHVSGTLVRWSAVAIRGAGGDRDVHRPQPDRCP